MSRRYWAPILAVTAAIMILVPSTFAKGQAGDTFGVAFGPNRFPSGLNSATVNLTFETDTRVRLDVNVQGTDVRQWALRIYDAGTCQRPTHWVVTRPGENGAPLRVTTNSSVSIILNPLDVQRLRAVPETRNLAFLFAGSGAGSLNSGSPYRTCSRFGTGPVATTTRTTTSSTTSNTTSNTTNLTNTSACVTTRTINGTISTITGGTTVINSTSTGPGVVTTIPATTATIGGSTATTNVATTISGTATTITGTVVTIPGTVTTIAQTVSTGSGVVTTVPVTTVTVTGGTSTSFGTVTTATGTRTTINGTGSCVFP